MAVKLIKMDTSGRKESVGETDEEFRVKVKSKKLLTEQMEKYKEVLKTALHGVTDVEEETRRALLQELLSVGFRKLTTTTLFIIETIPRELKCVTVKTGVSSVHGVKNTNRFLRF